MKNFVFRLVLALLLISAAGGANAQTVTKQPFFAATNAWVDLGNGPLEIMPIEGSSIVFASSGAGVGSTSGSSTTLTLTATPAVAPCVGCIISGTGITSGTTVAAFNGTTTVTLSAAMTVAASTPLAWGAACPATGTFPTAPSATGNTLSAPLNLRAGVDPFVSGIPLYTQGRICLYGGQQQGGTVVTFAIGAH